MSGILSDSAIKQAIEAGNIKIEGWNEAHLNPTSYDLTLGEEVTIYNYFVSAVPSMGSSTSTFIHEDRLPLDVRHEPKTTSFRIDKDRGVVLRPGIGYLMHTEEAIWTDKYVPIVDGKSSTGRLFMQIHCTAGYGDPGFNGQYTLEVSVVHPLQVYPGMRIAQIRFHTIAGVVEKPYAGNYTGQAARGAVPSRAWKQFLKG